MQTIGERFEEARKKKGISIREAAEATKIRGDYLQKFESNHFDIGLTEIYTRGFLRNYAFFLKLPADRILNDYSALGRGEIRPRQPSREIYGRMDISVATADEASDRAAPPDDKAAAEPVRAQPRYPRGGSSLPQGPDPAVVFKYVKWAGIGVVVLLAVWAVKSLFSGGSPAANAPHTATTTAPARPVVDNKAVITARDVVRVQVWEKIPNAPTPAASYGVVLLQPTTLNRGETVSFVKTGPVYISASARENIQIDFAGQQFTPGSAPYNITGAGAVELQ